MTTNNPDYINHPPHYAGDTPANIECIDITRHLSFCRGNAVKYVWRAGRKGSAVTDLEKALWYADEEVDAKPSPAALAVFRLLRANHEDEGEALRYASLRSLVNGWDARRIIHEYKAYMEGMCVT